MKKLICITLIFAILLIMPACKAKPTITASKPSISPGNVVEEITDKGILVTTKYYSLLLPDVWKNNYQIECFELNNDGYTLSFIEPVSKEQCGGLIFDLTLARPVEFPQNPLITYLGGLYSPNHGMFAIGSRLPTDVQFIEQKMETYLQMKDTYQQVIDSLEIVDHNGCFYPTGANTFEQRAKLTTHSEKGEAVIHTYLTEKEPQLNLEYLGIAIEDFKEKSSYLNNNGYYGYHIWIPKGQKAIYYGVPFNQQEGILPIVCKMTQYPIMESIWHSEEPETIAYRNFIEGMLTTANEDLGGYLDFDLDLDGTKELLLNNNGVLTVYGLQNRRVVKLDSFRYDTGTMAFYHTKPDPYEEPVYNKPLPGLFTRWAGGGQNHYGYLTLEKGKLVNTLLWDENYSSLPGTPPTTNHTEDEKLIRASKIAYERIGFINIAHVYKDTLKEKAKN